MSADALDPIWASICCNTLLIATGLPCLAAACHASSKVVGQRPEHYTTAGKRLNININRFPIQSSDHLAGRLAATVGKNA